MAVLTRRRTQMADTIANTFIVRIPNLWPTHLAYYCATRVARFPRYTTQVEVKCNLVAKGSYS